ncbi:MAG: hypothetical protein QOG91_477 [Candidatus Parcubacteria bacterium]|jgi:hypothetical protein|nr:hypothetical protein [Candidatus Parcubacteria bacterium]
MPSFFPSKQTVIIFVVCLGLVAAAAAYVNAQKPAKQDSPPQSAAAAATAAGISHNDPGLSAANTDWQKEFLDTGASSTGSFDKTAATTTAAPEHLTATDLLGRSFFTKYVELRQSGLNTDANTVNDVAGQLVANSLASLPPPKSHALSELRISKTPPTKPELEAYGRNILGIVANSVPPKEQNEAAIAMQALDNDDMTLLKNIDRNISGYQTAVKSLLALEAPAALAQSQLDLTNAFEISLSNARSFRNADSDPVRTLTAVRGEIDSLQQMKDAVDSIQQYLVSAGVPFGP